MDIALFGGTFDPVHNGHVALARHVAARRDIDAVWMTVTPENPLKTGSRLLGDSRRLELCRLAVEGIPGVEASGFEFSLPRPSYTYATLNALRQAYPEYRFHLLVGADNWKIFRSWADWEKILEGSHVMVYPRPGVETAPELPEGVEWLHDAPLSPLSSTQVREALAAGRDITAMVPPAVARALYETL